MAASAKAVTEFHGRKINTENILSNDSYFFSVNVPLSDSVSGSLNRQWECNELKIRASMQKDMNCGLLLNRQQG